jgi:hypothetical protein
VVKPSVRRDRANRGSRRLAVAFAVTLSASSARADNAVGVVVTGDEGLQAKVTSHLERWLTQHGHKLAADPLSADAAVAIDNCLVLSDATCARSVVEARGNAESIVFAHVETKQRNVSISTYWFVKGHEPIGERRVCEHCAEDAWRAVADTMMDALAGGNHAPQGRVKIGSKPSGLIVLLDNAQIGMTPLDRDVPVGHHEVKLLRDGREVGGRAFDLTSGETKRVMIQAKWSQPRGGNSRVGPLLMLIAGGATLGTGLGFIYVGERGGPDQKYVYPDSTPVGIGLSVVGAGAALGGIIWFAQSSSSSSSAPTISLAAGGASVGWSTRF